jgi:hypothetical protein
MWWTFAAASIASCTALFIALYAYPLQKDEDRKLQLHSEKRAVYTAVLSSFNSWFAALARNQQDSAKERYFDFVGEVMRLQLYGNRAVLYKARALIDIAKKYRDMRLSQNKADDVSAEMRRQRSELFVQVKAERTAFIATCRSDLMIEDFSTSKEIIGAFAPIEDENQ